MRTSPQTDPPGKRGKPLDAAMRRRLVVLASLAAALAVYHFVDHAIRGEIVVHNGLNPDWNHSGWPFDDHTDKPYLFPIYFIVVNGLLLGGILLTLRGRLWAGFWLATSLVLIALLAFVHFVGSAATAAETPSVIARTHDHSVLSVLGLIDIFGLLAALIVLAFHAGRTRQRSGRW